jgi:hypothetical protein
LGVIEIEYLSSWACCVRFHAAGSGPRITVIAERDPEQLQPCQGVGARVAQRLLALAAGIWHNWATNAESKRSLTAYDH